MVSTRRTYRKRRHVTDEASNCIVQFLKIGSCTASPDSDLRLEIFLGEFPNDEQLKDYWERMGEDILGGHILQHPCTRPWAWWHFDAPEPRRMVGDPQDVGLEPHDVRFPARRYKWKLYFGMPHGFRILGTCVVSGFGLKPDDDARFESLFEKQAVFLERLGLMMPEERRSFQAT